MEKKKTLANVDLNLETVRLLTIIEMSLLLAILNSPFSFEDHKEKLMNLIQTNISIKSFFIYIIFERRLLT